MSEYLVRTGIDAPSAETQLQAWQEPRPPVPALASSPLERPVAAVRRYKWLIASLILVAIAAGFVVTQVVTPRYQVRASIMIASETPFEKQLGPIRSTGLLTSDDWTQLLRSFTITDAVVRKLSLYLQPDNQGDEEVLKDFRLAARFIPAKYELIIDRGRKTWTLSSDKSGPIFDKGTMADSVGRKFGFQWVLPDWLFTGSGTHKVKFTVATPREVAVKLVQRLSAQRQLQSNFLQLTLEDPDPELAARILNTWVREYVSVAAALKKHKLVDFGRTLEAQLLTAKNALDSAENQLQSFRVNTITQPSEGTGSPISAGVAETRDPVIRAYFEKKIEYDDIKHDIRLLKDLIAISKDSVPGEALLQIRSVASGAPSGQALRTVLEDYRKAELNLSAARIGYTDEHPTVRTLLAQVNTYKRERIPQLASALLKSLQTKAQDDSTRISGASSNLQKIPQRTIEEERLRRLRDIAAGLYTNLQNRYQEAQLAEASATPDVSILDSAIAPLQPSKNTAPRLIFMTVMGGIAGALGLAILLDRMDNRLRYPDQVGAELGLPIAGTVPRFPKKGVDWNSPEQTFQLVESFRSLRMNVMHASAGLPVTIAISSPSPGEGKSLVAANLAMSFADAGYRTVLVDGDTRRGALHEMFGMQDQPGLTEYLAGAARLHDVAKPAEQDSLTLIPCGIRKRRSPELLTSHRLPTLVAELRDSFDIVIFDTPPLAAGIDAYSIAAATGSLLVVLRVGQTMRRMTAEKLRPFERLPVNVIGAVLNGIDPQGEFSYYSYIPGYSAEDEPEGAEVVNVT